MFTTKDTKSVTNGFTKESNRLYNSVFGHTPDCPLFFVTYLLSVVSFVLSVVTFVVNFEQFVTLPTNLIDNCIEKIYIQNNGSPADRDRYGGLQIT